MGLAEARAAAFERWKTAKAGGNPRKADGRAVAGPTFAEAAEAVIAMHEPTWRSPKSGPQWRVWRLTPTRPSVAQLDQPAGVVRDAGGADVASVVGGGDVGRQAVGKWECLERSGRSVARAILEARA